MLNIWYVLRSLVLVTFLGICNQVIIGRETLNTDRPPLNVLLIVTDDQRPDTIAALGNPVIRTPTLDRLVAEGTTFTRATCAHPICFASRAELLTGQTGFRNGVFTSNAGTDFTLPTLPQRLAAAGYRTQWVGKWHLAGRPSQRGIAECLGLFGSGKRPDSPGVDSYGREITGYVGWMFQTDDRQFFPEQGQGLHAEISANFAEAAIEFLNQPAEQPFFLQVNFTAPHDPLLLPQDSKYHYDPQTLAPPKNWLPQHPFDHGNSTGRDEKLLPWPRTAELLQRELAAYYAVISHMDAQIGRILQALERSGKSDQTLVLFTSDHGLAMGSHGLRGKQNMYEHTINVPLIFRGPTIRAAQTCSAQCYLRDLVPTILEYCNLPHSDLADSQSLLPVLTGQQKEVHPFIVGYFQNSQRMIRQADWKLVVYPAASRRQLFDLKHDPLERKNLTGQPEIMTKEQELWDTLTQWLTTQNDPLVTSKTWVQTKP